MSLPQPVETESSGSVLRSPTGPYQVGIREFDWTDNSRPETFTSEPSDHRRIKVTALYPAAPGDEAAASEPYVNAYEFEPAVGAYLGAHRIPARKGVPPLDSAESLPVLLYNPGHLAYRMTGSFVALELASRGYVVFAIEHPGDGLLVRFGELEEAVNFDARRPPTANTVDCDRDPICLASTTTSIERYIVDTQLPVWIDDTAFTLQQLRAGALMEVDDGGHSETFLSRLDLERIGVLGWSLGGSTALQATADDSSAPLRALRQAVAAAVNHDGAVRGTVERIGPGETPVLYLHQDGTWQSPSTDDPLKPFLDAQIRSMKAVHLLARSPTFDYTITGAEHAWFADTSRMDPQGEEAALHEAQDAIVTLTLAFFDRFLRGHDVEVADVARRFPHILQNTRPAP